MGETQQNSVMFSTITNYFQKNNKRMSFEDVQFAIQHPSDFLIINTLPINEQDCLIKNTLAYHMEESIINDLLNQYAMGSKKIVIYGKNSQDDTADKKCKQLVGLGFIEVYIYNGGMFEWMLLQDIYGFDEFPSTRKVLDILKYKPSRTFGIHRIGYY